MNAQPIIRRDGMRFALALRPGASFFLMEYGVIVVEPDEPPKLYVYRDDGPPVCEVIDIENLARA